MLQRYVVQHESATNALELLKTYYKNLHSFISAHNKFFILTSDHRKHKEFKVELISDAPLNDLDNKNPVLNTNQEDFSKTKNINYAATVQNEDNAEEKVLLITGCSLLECEKDFYETKLFPSDGELQSMWNEFTITRCDFSWGRDKGKVNEIIAELRSGKYCVVVVSNLSEISSQRHISSFERSLSLSLKAFVAKGGSIAFPTCELGVLLPYVNRMFNTNYVSGGYYRSKYRASAPNLNTVNTYFGGLCGSMSYSAKTLHLNNVPQSERCFCVFSDESYSGGGGGGGGGGEGDDDCETGVVLHHVGDNGGSIALFGDVNCETETSLLVHEYIARAFDRNHMREMRFDQAFEFLISPPRAAHACSHCNADNAVMKCSQCHDERYCNAECQRKGWKIHKLLCGKSVDDLTVQWKTMDPLNRRTIMNEMRSHACRRFAEFLEERRELMEKTFDAVVENNVTSLELHLQLIDVNTDASEAGLGGLPEGMTLLQYAVQQEEPLAVMQMLLSHGADPNRADEAGRTAYGCLLELHEMGLTARLKNKDAVIDLLKRSGYRLRAGERWEIFQQRSRF